MDGKRAKPLKVAFVSLGCAKNQVDTEVMAGLISKAGHHIVMDGSDAQTVIINTCSFIQQATQESINTLLEYAQLKEQGKLEKIIVCGCLAKRYAPELRREIPEIDAFLEPQELERIVHILGDAKKNRSPVNIALPPRLYTTPASYAYLKIADGCNNRCSYCIIPQVRGPYRSRSSPSLILEAKRLVNHGFHEIILIAQDTTGFGQDTGERLEDLLLNILELDNLGWLRLLYTYPAKISDELLQILSRHEKACPYLDLPLQHINDPILARMRRKGNKREIYNLIERIKSAGIAIRTTFMVGFPGETEEQFQELLDFVGEVEFDHLGSFTYSAEEDTRAALLDDQVPEEEKQRRQEALMLLQQEISCRNLLTMRGSIQQVLVDEPADDDGFAFQGHTCRQAPEVDGVVYLNNKFLEAGQLVTAKVINTSEYDLEAELVE